MLRRLVPTCEKRVHHSLRCGTGGCPTLPFSPRTARPRGFCFPSPACPMRRRSVRRVPRSLSLVRGSLTHKRAPFGARLWFGMTQGRLLPMRRRSSACPLTCVSAHLPENADGRKRIKNAPRPICAPAHTLRGSHIPPPVSAVRKPPHAARRPFCARSAPPRKKRSREGSALLFACYLSSAKYLIVRTIWLVYEFSLSYQETTLTSVEPSPMDIHLVCVASNSEP